MEISPTQFDLLDITFLIRLADRLNVDRHTLLESSKHALSEINQKYHSEEHNERDEDEEFQTIFNYEMVADDDEENFRAELQNFDSFMSTTVGSMISGSTPKSVLYTDYDYEYDV